MRHTYCTLLATVVALALVVAGCRREPETAADDPVLLLKDGRFAEARAAATRRGFDTGTAEERAILALAIIGEAAGPSAGRDAAKILGFATAQDERARSSLALLDLADGLNVAIGSHDSLVIAEVAVAGVGHHPLAATRETALPAPELSRPLALRALSRAAAAMSLPNATIDERRLAELWEGGFALLDRSLDAAGAAEAWAIFRPVATLGVIVADTLPRSPLGERLLGVAIEAIERNADIAVAARCDLGSPFDEMRRVLSHDRRLLGRLEGAVASASGCSRGTYAP